MKNLTLFLLVFVFASCEDFLAEDPKSLVAIDQFYETADDALAGVNAIYAPLPTTEFHDFLMTIATTDDGYVEAGAGAALVQAMWRYTFTPNNTRVFTPFWEIQYQIINRANSAIANVPAVEMDVNLKNRLLGEAHFLRAFAYFKLVRFFGGVPLLTSPTVSSEGVKVERASAESVYEQIIADLTFAEENLMEQSLTEKGRPSVGAAKGLLARVYLTRENWSDAAQKAKEVIDLGSYNLMSDYSDLFNSATEDNNESIFAYQYAAQDGFGFPSKRYLPRNVIPNWRGLGAFAPTQNLYESFEPNDLRRDITMVSSWTTDGGQTLTFNPWFRKFWDMSIDNTDNAAIDVPIIRYADILLMYAEALNEAGGPTPEAYDAVNMIRRRGYGLAITSPSDVDLPAGLDQEAFRQAVWKERRWEFGGEYHRWFDLKRTGRLMPVVSDYLNSVEGTSTFEEKHLLYPIPQTEIDANPNLIQNPNW